PMWPRCSVFWSALPGMSKAAYAPEAGGSREPVPPSQPPHAGEALEVVVLYEKPTPVSSGRGGKDRSIIRQAGVEDIAQAITEEVEAQHRQGDGQARENGQVRQGLHMLAGQVEVGAPVRRGWRCP